MPPSAIHPRPSWMRHHVKSIRHREWSVAKKVCELEVVPLGSPGIRQLGIDFRESKKAGENPLVCIYGGKPGQNLD